MRLTPSLCSTSISKLRQYVRMLYSDQQMKERLQGCRHLMISDENLQKLGTSFSYNDYDEFFERELAPLDISNQQLLGDPETIIENTEPEDSEDSDDSDDSDFSDPTGNGEIDFDEDFYR